MSLFSRREFLKVSMAATCSLFVSKGLANDEELYGENQANFKKRNENKNVAFYHGVKSGDPLEDAVIIWTRVTPKKENIDNIPLFFEVAKDEKFNEVVNNGKIQAKRSDDYTVKIDVQNLEAYTKYFYRFRTQESKVENRAYSIVGKMQTLPEIYSDPEQVKMAVFSCANYPNGYFNAYKEASKIKDLDFTLHLGDYIYEYGQWKDDDFEKKIPDYGTKDSFKIGRNFPEDNNKECISLEDYRKRYALYSLDEGLISIHAHCPMIAVWDDHEICNDAYKNNAENHNKDEGEYDKRVEAALKAYFEWIPIRPVQDKRKVYRNFHFGQLMSLHILETRLHARDKSFDMIKLLNTDNITGIKSSDKNLLGYEQKEWLQYEMIKSNATWQVLGQQVLMGRMWIPIPISDILFNTGVVDIVGAVKEIVKGSYTGKFTRKSKRFLKGVLSVLRYLKYLKDKKESGRRLNLIERYKINKSCRPFNLDSWDGYHKERESLLEFVNDNNLNFVVLSGDSHNAWANNLTLDDKDKTPVGVEFATSSVTSSGIEAYFEALSEDELLELEELVQYLIDDLEYCNLKDRGFMEVSFTKDEAKCTYHFINNNKSPRFYTKQKDREKTIIHKVGNKELT